MISEQLKKARKEKRITQKALGKKIGITRQVISRIENNENGNILMLESLIDELGYKLLMVDKDCDVYIKQK